MIFQKSIPEIEEKVVRLAEYFSAMSDGSNVSWEQIATDTKIEMDTHGRSLARRALKRIKRPYAAVRAVGVTLSAPVNTIQIVSNRFVRVDNALRRADTTRKQLAERHFDHLEERDKGRMLTLAGFFGAVRVFAKEAKTKILGRPIVAESEDTEKKV